MALFGKMFGGKPREEKPGEKKKPPSQELPEINLDDVEAKKPPAQQVAPSPFDTMPKEFGRPPTPTPGGAKPSSRRSSRVGGRGTPIGELLIQAGAISTEQLSKSLKIQEKEGKGLLGQILVKMGACTPTDVSAALAKQFRITGLELGMVEPTAAAMSLVPKEKCFEHKLMPFEKLGNLLCLAMANVLNRKAINEIEQATNCRVKPFNSTWPEIQEAIAKFYTPEILAAASATAAGGAPQEVALAEVTPEEVKLDEEPPALAAPAAKPAAAPKAPAQALAPAPAKTPAAAKAAPTAHAAPVAAPAAPPKPVEKKEEHVPFGALEVDESKLDDRAARLRAARMASRKGGKLAEAEAPAERPKTDVQEKARLEAELAEKDIDAAERARKEAEALLADFEVEPEAATGAAEPQVAEEPEAAAAAPLRAERMAAEPVEEEGEEESFDQEMEALTEDLAKEKASRAEEAAVEEAPAEAPAAETAEAEAPPPAETAVEEPAPEEAPAAGLEEELQLSPEEIEAELARESAERPAAAVEEAPEPAAPEPEAPAEPEPPSEPEPVAEEAPVKLAFEEKAEKAAEERAEEVTEVEEVEEAPEPAVEKEPEPEPVAAPAAPVAPAARKAAGERGIARPRKVMIEELVKLELVDEGDFYTVELPVAQEARAEADEQLVPFGRPPELVSALAKLPLASIAAQSKAEFVMMAAVAASAAPAIATEEAPAEVEAEAPEPEAVEPEALEPAASPALVEEEAAEAAPEAVPALEPEAVEPAALEPEPAEAEAPAAPALVMDEEAAPPAPPAIAEEELPEIAPIELEPIAAKAAARKPARGPRSGRVAAEELSDEDFESLAAEREPDPAQEWDELYVLAGPISPVPLQK